VNPIYITSPSFTAAVALMNAIVAAVPGANVSVVAWGQQPQSNQCGFWLLITPGGRQADWPFTPLKYGIIDLDWPPAQQLTSALQLTDNGPGMSTPAGHFGNPADHT
jgi:hypothetical protein